ncbi:MAG: penicillin-binding protein 2, partial [Pseudomonadota bacterium]
MTAPVRAPLRPLAQVLTARQVGANPDLIERENLGRRHEVARNRLRQRAESRILMLALCFLAAFMTVGMRMSSLAASEAEETAVDTSGAAIVSARADIVDRNGRILASNLSTHALFAHTEEMVDPEGAAAGLAAIFPELDEAELLADFTSDARFVWIRRNISPEQEQRVHDLGQPGLHFGQREMRLYPNGALAAHILGGARFGREETTSAEVIGAAGVEAAFDAFLRDPANEGAPLRLSLDLTLQAAMEEVLAGGMSIMHAEGAAAVLMEVQTGQILAIASLPDFDPNAPPPPQTDGADDDSPLFNRAIQGVYELGSVFKAFTIAQALDLNLVSPATPIDTTGPLRLGGFSIRDFRDHGPVQSVREVIVNSSNIGTARIAADIGAPRQRAFLEALGFTAPLPVEVIEARRAAPILPQRWGDLTIATVSYGHGIAVSPLHLAAGYATILGDGRLVTPTLLADAAPTPGPQVIAPETVAEMRDLLRAVVRDGTATMADVPGYSVAGKTGTADLPLPDGSGYYEDRTRTTFAAAFPADEPQYVLVVMLERPWISALG